MNSLLLAPLVPLLTYAIFRVRSKYGHAPRLARGPAAWVVALMSVLVYVLVWPWLAWLLVPALLFTAAVLTVRIIGRRV